MARHFEAMAKAEGRRSVTRKAGFLESVRVSVSCPDFAVVAYMQKDTNGADVSDVYANLTWHNPQHIGRVQKDTDGALIWIPSGTFEKVILQEAKQEA